MTFDVAGTPPPSPPVAAPPSQNSFARMAGVLFTPSETFEDIARKPDFVVPLLLILIIGYVCTILMVPHMDWNAVAEQQAQVMKKQNPNIKDADIERIGKMTKAFGSVMAYVSPLLGVLWYLIVALVLFGAFRLMGGEGTFKQAFSATLYAWIPLVIFSIILTVVAVTQGTIDPTTMATAVKSNPAFLVDMKEQPVLFALLSALDLFTLWTIALLITGFAALSKKKWANSAAIVVSLWLIMVVIRVGLAALGAMRAGA